MSGKGLADMLFQPHSLEHLDALALSLLCLLFACRTMFALFLQLFAGHGLLFAGEDIFLHKPVNHQIRIPADGRSEMRIVGKSKAVVTDVVGRIDGFRLRADGKEFYRAPDTRIR